VTEAYHVDVVRVTELLLASTNLARRSIVQ
jgi:hypothetical protein